MKNNHLRNFALGLLFATGACLNASALPASPQAEVQVTYTCGDIKPDPNRNLVYVVDQTDNAILAFDTSLGTLSNQVSILDGNTTGSLAVSPDGSRLYLAESAENKILVFSLPSLTPRATISVTFSPGNLVVGSGGRLYSSKGVSAFNNSIVEVNTSTGAIVQTFGITESYYSQPLLRTNTNGKNLYACPQGIDGILPVNMYDISGTTASTATPYDFDCEFLNDFQPDETYNRIYATCGAPYGIEVINTLTDDYSTVWRFSQPYGESVSFSPTASVVFGSSDVVNGGDIMTFNRADGTPLADNIFPDNAVSVKSAGLAATPNGNVLYIRQSTYVSAPTHIGIIGLSHFNPSGDPLGGTYINGGYYYNPSFGYYNETYYPWIYHVNLVGCFALYLTARQATSISTRSAPSLAGSLPTPRPFPTSIRSTSHRSSSTRLEQRTSST